MSLILTGNTSNITIDSTNGITFPNASLQNSAGKILQVVQGTLSTVASSSSSTLADTGLTASITPLFATSKILVIASMSACGKETNNTYMRLALLRGASIIQYFENIGAYDNSTGFNYIGTIAATYLDSPATTSATTYKVQFSSGNNNAIIYISGIAATIQPTSTITLMEVAV
jgi:hypothetical protein